MTKKKEKTTSQEEAVDEAKDAGTTAAAKAKAKAEQKPDPVGPFLIEGEGGYKPSAPGKNQVAVYDKRTGLQAAILPSKAEARAWADIENKKVTDAKKEPRIP